MAIQKTFLAKVYSQDGTTLQGILTTDLVLVGSQKYLKQIPTFKTRLNNGQGELVLDIKCPFDNFGEGTLVDFMNIVKVYAIVVDDTISPITQAQTLIYTGFVSRYEPYVDMSSGDEGVRMTCLGLVSLLSRSYYGSFGISRGPEDPTVTAKNIIDNFNTIYGGNLITYDSSSVPATVGTNITYSFVDQKWLDALVTVGKLANPSWWFAIREDGKLYYKQKNSTATHRFTIGKDIVSLQGLKDSEKVINDIEVRRTGGAASDYSDATSQATYGTGSPPMGKISEIISDSGISNSATSDQRGDTELADKKDANLTGTITISAKYSQGLESIHVGDTCTIFNYASTSTFFPANMLIASTVYKGDTVDVELQQITTDFGTALNKFVNGI